MSDSVLPFLKQAFQSADACYANFDDIVGQLEEAIDILPEDNEEIQTLASEMMEQALELQDSLRPLLDGLYNLRLKYRASYMPIEVSPEVDELLEVLARIETRRRGSGPKQE